MDLRNQFPTVRPKLLGNHQNHENPMTRIQNKPATMNPTFRSSRQRLKFDLSQMAGCDYVVAEARRQWKCCVNPICRTKTTLHHTMDVRRSAHSPGSANPKTAAAARMDSGCYGGKDRNRQKLSRGRRAGEKKHLYSEPAADCSRPEHFVIQVVCRYVMRPMGLEESGRA